MEIGLAHGCTPSVVWIDWIREREREREERSKRQVVGFDLRPGMVKAQKGNGCISFVLNKTDDTNFRFSPSTSSSGSN